MTDVIYKDSSSAWRGLRKIGGIEVDGRDEDIVEQLRIRLSPNASDLDTALEESSTEDLLQAFFQVMQPFALMYRDILEFFNRAGAKGGKKEWKVKIDKEIFELRHFEEYLEQIRRFRCEVEAPGIDAGRDPWILHAVWRELGQDGFDRLTAKKYDREDDINTWLEAYQRGQYLPLPARLHPDRLQSGIADAARIAVGALSVIRTRGFSRKQLISALQESGSRKDPRDGFHLLSIAQNETDRWLEAYVKSLAELLSQPAAIQRELSEKLTRHYARLPRRRITADLEINDIERVLSLPAWQRRHEFYAVWIATEIVRSLHGHNIKINHSNGELKFSFSKTRVADIKTARPFVSLYSERRISFDNPIGRGRRRSVQPDFGLWKNGNEPENCTLIVEVKHYKKQSRRNFESALFDYANAHPKAKVILVNYGPVIAGYDAQSGRRAMMIGHLSPMDNAVRDSFQKEVRSCVGEPIYKATIADVVRSSSLVVVDTSNSMLNILEGGWFKKFCNRKGISSRTITLVDSDIRGVVESRSISKWLGRNMLGQFTNLSVPLLGLLQKHSRILVVTDREGADELHGLGVGIVEVTVRSETDVRVVQICSDNSGGESLRCVESGKIY